MKLTVLDVLTSSGKYPERETHFECTAEVRANAAILVDRVNALLAELGIESCEITSGFRPSSVNGSIKGAAKRSLHMIGKAVDLADPTGKLKATIKNHSGKLKVTSLWMEHPDATPTWCHLDWGSRQDRLVRIFKP